MPGTYTRIPRGGLHPVRPTALRLLVALALIILAASAIAQPTTATGVVFEDTNRNGSRDGGEVGVPGVGVSNGTDVVVTDAEGRWALAVEDGTILFVIKPSDWSVPVSAGQVPRFYYIHKPEGSPRMKCAGLDPTGPLPASVDFPLCRSEEPESFRVLLMGDSQTPDRKATEYLAHDVVDEIIGANLGARMAFSLGDVCGDSPSLFGRISDVMGTMGIPVYYVLGNHDRNYDAPSLKDTTASFQRNFGPTTYSLNYGKVHFIVLDDVVTTEGSKYTGGFSDSQLAFVRNDLALVPKDALVVYMMHIPMAENVQKRAEFFALFAGRENVFGASAHWHTQSHHFLGKEQGWPGDKPHHHLVNVTSCGSWWGGKLDYFGLPDTTMGDGAPNGFTILTCSGNQYETEFVPSRLPRSYQMRIWAPQTVSAATGSRVYVNVFAGSERSTVRMRVDDSGQWVDLQRIGKPDPADVEAYQKVFAEKESKRAKYENEYTLGGLVGSPHLWSGTLPTGLSAGYHVLHVRTTDMYGHTYDAARAFEVE